MTGWLLTWWAQGTLLALAAAAVLRVARPPAASRHLVWWGVLVAIAWIGAAPMLSPREAAAVVYTAAAPDALVNVLALVWAGVAVFSLVRLAVALVAMRGIRRRCVPMPPQVASALSGWHRAAQAGRAARLSVCDAIPVASVLGMGRAHIAVPSAVVAGLTHDELDQVVLHELAHVRRFDDWTRLLQCVLQSIMWFHPAVPFVGRAIDLERESACDDWVIACTGARSRYARCLARAAELSLMRPVRLVSPALLSHPAQLMRRVDRILSASGTFSPGRARAVTAAALLSVGLLAMLGPSRPLIVFLEQFTLPLVGRPAAAVADAARIVGVPIEMAAVTSPPLATRPRAAAAQRLTQDANRTAGFDSRPVAIPESAPVAGRATASAAVEVTHSRTFTGLYRTTPEPAVLSDQGSWSRASRTGARVGAAAARFGTDMAGAFSRAGVSVARSF